MNNKSGKRDSESQKPDSQKPTDLTEHISRQDVPVKKSYNSIVDTHPPPNEKPKK
jgi:hypothetical protein